MNDLKNKPLSQHTGTTRARTGADEENYTGQTISLIMRNLLIAISNSATISSEGLIVQLLGVLIADVLIMDPHNAHLAISRFMPHASRRAPGGLIAGPHSDMPATELVAPMPPSAPADG